MATGDRQRPAEAAPQWSVLHSIDGACVRLCVRVCGGGTQHVFGNTHVAQWSHCAHCASAGSLSDAEERMLCCYCTGPAAVCLLVERSWFSCCRHTVLCRNCNVAREETKKPHQETERGEGNRWRDRDPAQADTVSERKESSAANIWHKFICALLQKVAFISVVAKAAPTNLVSDPYQG